jgi:hypothetical protein
LPLSELLDFRDGQRSEHTGPHRIECAEDLRRSELAVGDLADSHMLHQPDSIRPAARVRDCARGWARRRHLGELALQGERRALAVHVDNLGEHIIARAQRVLAHLDEQRDGIVKLPCGGEVGQCRPTDMERVDPCYSHRLRAAVELLHVCWRRRRRRRGPHCRLLRRWCRRLRAATVAVNRRRSLWPPPGGHGGTGAHGRRRCGCGRGEGLGWQRRGCRTRGRRQ